MRARALHRRRRAHPRGPVVARTILPDVRSRWHRNADSRTFAAVEADS
jgi:hypothetical protein